MWRDPPPSVASLIGFNLMPALTMLYAHHLPIFGSRLAERENFVNPSTISSGLRALKKFGRSGAPIGSSGTAAP